MKYKFELSVLSLAVIFVFVFAYGTINPLRETVISDATSLITKNTNTDSIEDSVIIQNPSPSTQIDNSNTNLISCDFDQNGILDIIDVLHIKQVEAGLINAPDGFDIQKCNALISGETK